MRHGDAWGLLTWRGTPANPSLSFSCFLGFTCLRVLLDGFPFVFPSLLFIHVVLSGKTDEQPTKIGGPLKKEWRFFTAPATTHDQIVEHHKLAKQAREAKAAQHAAQPAPAS